MDVSNCTLVHCKVYSLDPKSVTPRGDGDLEIKFEQTGPGLQMFPIAAGVTSYQAPGNDGVVHIEASLTPEATQLFREAGYTDDTLVFNMGRRPAKYKNPDHLPPVEYKWDSADKLLDGIFDYYYRDGNLDAYANTYKSIQLTLYPSKEAPKVKDKITTDLDAIPRDLLDGIRFVIDA